jgi:hypothetical protein
VEWIWQGKPKYSEKTCSSATLSTTNPTWRDPGSNPGRRGGKPATNRLSYGVALPASSKCTYVCLPITFTFEICSFGARITRVDFLISLRNLYSFDLVEGSPLCLSTYASVYIFTRLVARHEVRTGNWIYCTPTNRNYSYNRFAGLRTLQFTMAGAKSSTSSLGVATWRLPSMKTPPLTRQLRLEATVSQQAQTGLCSPELTIQFSTSLLVLAITSVKNLH